MFVLIPLALFVLYNLGCPWWLLPLATLAMLILAGHRYNLDMAKYDTWCAAATGGVELLGEEVVHDRASAVELADRMAREAAEIFARPSQDGWTTVAASDDVCVEAIHVKEGALKETGVLLLRSRFGVNAPAALTISFIGTDVGYKAIDPLRVHRNLFEPRHDFKAYHERYAWREGAGLTTEPKIARRDEVRPGDLRCSRIDVVDAAPHLPSGATRELSLVHAVDVGAGLVLSKSVLHASRPGGSEYNCHGWPPPPGGAVRALHTFAVRATPRGADACVVEVLLFTDLDARAVEKKEVPRMMTITNVDYFTGRNPFGKSVAAELRKKIAVVKSVLIERLESEIAEATQWRPVAGGDADDAAM